MMKCCAVVGGSGFIGTHLVRYLLAAGDYSRVYILDINPPKLTHPNVVFLSQDIRLNIEKFPKAVETVFHLAALAKEPGYSWDDYFFTNYHGTRNVLRWCSEIRVRNLIYVSTMMVFRAGERRNTEQSICSPDTAYGISKLLAEELVRSWSGKHSHRNTTIVRPGVVFGQGENGNYTRLYRALKRNVFAYVGRRTTIKSSIYVKDLVRFLVFLSKGNHKGVYHAVYPEPLTIEDISNTMCEVFGWKRFIPTIPYPVALMSAYGFEFLNFLGLRNGVHHRRIQKLYYSTDLSADSMVRSGFQLKYSLREAILDWRRDCNGDLY